jgi:hypothetical protein
MGYHTAVNGKQPVSSSETNPTNAQLKKWLYHTAHSLHESVKLHNCSINVPLTQLLLVTVLQLFQLH